MPNANYLCKFGESIFDVAVKLYGSVDKAWKILDENSTLIADFNTDLEGITIIYDTAYKGTNIVPLVTIRPPEVNLAQTYSPTDFQSIFDVTLQVYGNLSKVIEIVHNSTLNNINTDVKASDRFNYTLVDNSVVAWANKSGIVYQTKTPITDNTLGAFDTSFDQLAFN